MEKLFAWDGKFFRIMGKAADLMVLNLFWIISSLPVITAGASTVALYSVTMQMTGNTEGYIRKEYWKSFFMNLKQATISWLIFLTVQLMVMIGFKYCNCDMEGRQGAEGAKICLWIVVILLFLIPSYVFPMMAYHNIGNTISLWKRAAVICAANLPWSLLLVAGEGVLATLTCRYVMQAAPVWLLAGGAVYAYITSFIYLHVFHKSDVLPERIDTVKKQSVDLVRRG